MREAVDSVSVHADVRALGGGRASGWWIDPSASAGATRARRSRASLGPQLARLRSGTR